MVVAAFPDQGFHSNAIIPWKNTWMMLWNTHVRFRWTIPLKPYRSIDVIWSNKCFNDLTFHCKIRFKIVTEIVFYLLVTIVDYVATLSCIKKAVYGKISIRNKSANCHNNNRCNRRVKCHGQSRLYYKVFCMVNLHGRTARLTAWLLCTVDLRVKLHGSYA